MELSLQFRRHDSIQQRTSEGEKKEMIITIKCFAKTENTSSLCVITLLTFLCKKKKPKFAVSLQWLVQNPNCTGCKAEEVLFKEVTNWSATSFSATLERTGRTPTIVKNSMFVNFVYQCKNSWFSDILDSLHIIIYQWAHLRRTPHVTWGVFVISWGPYL